MVQALMTAVSAVHDAIAMIELHGVIHPTQALLGELIPTIGDPAVNLHQQGWAEVVLGHPSVR